VSRDGVEVLRPAEQRHLPSPAREQATDDRAERARARYQHGSFGRGHRRTIRARPGHDKVSELTRGPRISYVPGVIQADRRKALFLDLVQIASLSRRGLAISERLAGEMEVLGGSVSFDDAGAAVGGEVGNLVARIPGTADAPAMLLCAHMDTVEPGAGVKPI